MPSAFLQSLFGKKKPTSTVASGELAKVEAALAAVPARIVAAEAALKRVADLTDDEHAAAEAELAAAKRSVARLEAQAGRRRGRDPHGVVRPGLSPRGRAGAEATRGLARGTTVAGCPLR